MNLRMRWCMCVIFGFSKTVKDINCFEDLKACFTAINKHCHDAVLEIYFRSHIPMTTGRFEQRISYIEFSYLTWYVIL